MSFIFQAVPDRYDLRTELREGKRVAWVASRYRDEMTRGDVVYLWRGGDAESRGIYGWGEISSDEPEQDADGTYRIAVKYRKCFLNHSPSSFITVDEIRSTAQLRTLLILRMPIGTNFVLSEAEDAALRQLIVTKLGNQWAPPQPAPKDGGN